MGTLVSNWNNRDLYSPSVDLSRISPWALKKKDRIISLLMTRLASRKANFISVDFPAPGFPLIHRKLFRSFAFIGSSQC